MPTSLFFGTLVIASTNFKSSKRHQHIFHEANILISLNVNVYACIFISACSINPYFILLYIIYLSYVLDVVSQSMAMVARGVAPPLVVIDLVSQRKN